MTSIDTAYAPARPHLPRIASLRRSLGIHTRARLPIDALVVSNNTNIGYLSGFTGSTALLVIGETDTVFITDGRYTAQAAIQCPEYTVVEAKSSGGYIEALAETLKERAHLHRVGFEDAHVTVNQLKTWRKSAPAAVRWTSASGLVEQLRLIKDSGEIALIRAAITIAESAFASVQEYLRPGIAERDFAIELEFTMRRLGAEAPSFDTIVASGPNGAFPHHHAGVRKFEAGDLVTIDWGARKDGYCSDITRTVAIPGKPVDETLRRIHSVVLTAKTRACEACLSGASGKAVDSVAREIIAAAGFGEAFEHSLGHSLGRDVHDGMTLAQRAGDVILADGIVTTVEPGIYIDGLGGVRIEEDVLVTSAEPIILTHPSPGL